ncbi:MAG: restriction endonuclease subunit S [Gilliamella sp.]|uniref:restriction endonuclease subunit S n=1 Tax=Gilliamella sp. TaxID=1891236 RepID=UPI0025CEA37D|nr:restriction endonuclease subunit S [Gilliamella sp.]MCO6549659.1 restriction endonuclease subunit S [Gilliamella sp.]
MINCNSIIELLKGVEVEWKALGEVAKITIGEFIHQNNQAESAKYPVYNGGISPTGYYNNFNNRGHKIIVSARGANAGFVNRISKPYWAGNSCYSIGIKDYYKLNWIFIYYFLKENEKNLIGSQQKGSIPSVSKKQMEKLQIPIPPLHVQTEIVRILDTFTALTAELTAELATRKKQYNYYLDKLLTFKEDEVEWKALGDVFNIFAGGDVPKDALSEKESKQFNIPILSNGIGSKSLYGWTNIPKINKPSLTISARGTIGWANYQEKPFYPVVRLLVLTPKIKVNLKYTYYFMKYIENDYKVPKSGIPQLTKPMIKDKSIPIPPLKEQARIVEILDKFDALTNSITEGLPREIELRQKQYEYYLNLLLDFPKAEQ